MKRLTFLFVLLLAFGLHAQSAVWVELHDSSLDTLTGVTADTLTESVNLNKKFSGGLFGGGQIYSPRYVLVETDVVEDINNGEGVTSRINFGASTGYRVAALDTQFTSPTAPSGVVFDLFDMRNSAYAGNRLQIVNAAYASAADTDSLSIRQRVYGLFEIE